MEVYSTEEEQVAALKKWWQDNGTAIIIGIIAGLTLLFGWQGWTKHQNQSAEQASANYMEIMGVMAAGDQPRLDLLVEEMLSEYPSTPYAPLSALASAKVAVENEDYATATNRLQWVIDEAKQVEIIYTAKLRLARVYIVRNELDAAKLLLDETFPPAYTAGLSELQGDWSAAKGDIDAAREAYTTALAAEIAPGNREMVEIKLESLGPGTKDDADS